MHNNEKFFMDEIKKGFYSVDSQGRIWKHYRFGNTFTGYKKLDKPKRAEFRNCGYLELSRRVNDVLIRAKASRIVWIYFHGDIDNDLQINHINGNRSDNRPSNIELVTQSENIQHAYRTGLAHGRPGLKHHNVKLTEDDVRKIRKLHKPHDGQCHPMTDEPRFSFAGLARMFGVSQGQIGKIVQRRRWKHIK